MSLRSLYDQNAIERNPIPFDNLDLGKYAVRKPRVSGARVVVGFDSETLHGYARLICASDGRQAWVDNADKALSFLCQRGYQKTLNFWFNLQFDFDAIVKWLPEDNLRELGASNKTEYHGYKISVIPKKTFRIVRNNHTHKFYDVAQFYESSLEVAAATFLGQSKFIEDIDRAMLGSDASYWAPRLHKILRYCANDARLTARLAERLQSEILVSCEFYPGSYVSKASLSAQYFRKNCEFPDVREIPHNVQEMAFNNYFGGRFEVTERGNVGLTTNLDIVSAYPYEIAQLIDPTLGTWRQVSTHHPDADLGFYLCKVVVPYMALTPLSRRYGQRVIYPVGSWGAFLSADEIRAYGRDIDIRVVTGYEFTADRIRYPFRDAIEHLFAQKQRSTKGTMQYLLYKRLMNSFYGKFYEKLAVGGRRYRAGLLFNPVYATLITGRCRIKMWQMARRFGNRCLSMATDGMLVRGDVDIESENVLGGWEVLEPAETIIIRSGMYQYGGELKQRGIMKVDNLKTKYGEFESVFDYIEQFPGLMVYPVINHRPRHLRECLQMKDEDALDHINVFEDITIKIDISKDMKRSWLSAPMCGSDLIEKRFESCPHDLNPTWEDLFPDMPMPAGEGP